MADRLVRLALSGPDGRAPDFGGPEVRTLAELTGAYLKATGRRKRILEVPLPGGISRALREGAHVASGTGRGTISWEEFLREELSPGPRAEGAGA